MSPNLSTVLDAALRLPLDQQDQLIEKIQERKRLASPKRGNVQAFFGVFDSGDVRSADNDKIDRDLAIEYSDNHESEN